MPDNPPDGNPKTAYGMMKPGLHAIPAVALLWLGQAMEEGRRKYGIVNWRDDPVTMSVYLNAAWRHLLAYQDGEDLDPESLNGAVPHIAKAMACFAIILDAEAHGTLTDDRGTCGVSPELMKTLTLKRSPDAEVTPGVERRANGNRHKGGASRPRGADEGGKKDVEHSPTRRKNSARKNKGGARSGT